MTGLLGRTDHLKPDEKGGIDHVNPDDFTVPLRPPGEPFNGEEIER
jgi:hypothetical protein